MNNIINLKNVSYEINNKTIINNITLNIDKNGLLIFFGENGAGKSTLLKLISGILKPTSGEIIISNEYIKENNRIGFVFQKTIFLNRTVKENLYHALYCSMNGLDKNKYNKLIENELKKVNMIHLLNQQAKVISIGEQQIISMIRSIIIEPKILLCDEPTSR